MALPTNIYAEVSTYFPGTIAPGAGISVSKSGNVWTVTADMAGIPLNSIALDKLEEIAADRLLGADEAGDVVELTASGGIEFTGAGGIQRSAITGDVAVPAGSGTAIIQPDAVTTAKILDANVTTSKIAPGAIDGTRIADDAVDGEHIADGAVGAATIADGAVTGPKIGAGAVDGTKIEDDAVDSEHIADGAIDTSHIADGQVTLSKMEVATRGDLITYAGNGAPTRLGIGSTGQVPTVNASGDLEYQTPAANKIWTLHVITSSDAAWPVPANTTEMIIEAAGGGGSGGPQSGGTARGGGGGGGSRLIKAYSGTMDATLDIQIGAGGVNGDGGATTVTGANLGTLTAPGGMRGGVVSGGAGGATPTGGDVNDRGGDGYTVSGNTVGVGYGGDCPMGGFGAKTNVGAAGRAPGGGGSGQNHSGGSSGDGARGEVRIWTR